MHQRRPTPPKGKQTAKKRKDNERKMRHGNESSQNSVEHQDLLTGQTPIPSTASGNPCRSPGHGDQ